MCAVVSGPVPGAPHRPQRRGGRGGCGGGRGLVGLQKLAPGTDPLLALSLLGITGLTAYFGTIEVGQVKPGDTFVVSGAAGATGSVAGMVAKGK